MTENPNQPANADADADSLDAQLADLLARIEQEEPGAMPAEVAASDESPPDALDAMIDRQVDEAIEAAESALTGDTLAEATAIESDAGAQEQPPTDELADQVQALLNDAKQHRPHPLDTDSLDIESDAVEDIDGELSGSFSAPDAVAEVPPTSEPPAVAALASDAVTDEADEADLAELDRLLADEAEDAVAGAFETPTEVAQQADTDEALDGTFESPDDLRHSGGSAVQVARELDDQPEQAVAEGTASADHPRDQPQLSFAALMLPRVERVARHSCGLLNAPLNRLDPELRNTIGYAGLLTTLSAIALILAAIIF